MNYTNKLIAYMSNNINNLVLKNKKKLKLMTRKFKPSILFLLPSNNNNHNINLTEIRNNNKIKIKVISCNTKISEKRLLQFPK